MFNVYVYDLRFNQYLREKAGI